MDLVYIGLALVFFAVLGALTAWFESLRSRS
jgi:hypothetical protein